MDWSLDIALQILYNVSHEPLLLKQWVGEHAFDTLSALVLSRPVLAFEVVKVLKAALMGSHVNQVLLAKQLQTMLSPGHAQLSEAQLQLVISVLSLTDCAAVCLDAVPGSASLGPPKPYVHHVSMHYAALF